MSRIPDCRTDENYNEKILNNDDSNYILGYDCAVEEAIENYFNNISNFEDEIAAAMGLEDDDIPNDLVDEDILSAEKEFDDYSEEELKEMGISTALLLAVKSTMLNWAEEFRDELITSMIEGMPDGEYEELKKKSQSDEYKNNIMRHREYMEKYERGEIPTCWTYQKDENGNTIKIGQCPNGDTVTEVVKSAKCVNAEDIIKKFERYNEFKILDAPVPFKELFSNENLDCVQLHSLELCGDNDIVGFCGQCAWKDGMFSSLDGDIYYEDMLVYGYNRFSNEKAHITNGVDILVEDW